MAKLIDSMTDQWKCRITDVDNSIYTGTFVVISDRSQICNVLFLFSNLAYYLLLQVKKPFRKNGRNVGMASTSIGRKEVSFIYVDHTINSARGQDEEDVGWWPRAEFMV